MKAKDLGSAGAWLELGKMSAQGIVLYPDNNVAMRCFEKAIELGSVGALVALGKLYNAWSDDDNQILTHGCGEPLSEQEVTNALQPLSDDVESEDYLEILKACQVFRDKSTSGCYQKAKELFEKAVSLGEGRGCFELAELYLFGDREKRLKYRQKAIELLKLQAQKGDGEAYVLMGRVLLMSRGDEVRDEVEQLYQKAIDLGYADGYGFLASMYNLSDHQDRKFNYSKQGAKLGSEEAARGLSVSMDELRHKGTSDLDDFELAVEQSIGLMDRLMECLKWQEFVALRCRHYGLLPHFLKNLSLAKAINSRVGLDQIERYKAFLEPDYDISDIIDAFVMRPDTWLVQRLADSQNLFDGFIFEASHLRAFATPYKSEFKMVTPDGRVEIDIS
ncbi:tetratricopeptide repeat protein [Helicobacter salomonis]|uniref:tetratricopeptide repeat protein n=1 Tax=Helicobacter salomonis TaxID=56878 RepID=UPI001F34619C|nr:tetratricopeptide repeat protein [Helicobacter salomonis]